MHNFKKGVSVTWKIINGEWKIIKIENNKEVKMKQFVIKIIINNIDQTYFEMNYQGTKKEAIKMANAGAMNEAIKTNEEVIYSIFQNGLMIRKGRIVPKITYRYVVDFKE